MMFINLLNDVVAENAMNQSLNQHDGDWAIEPEVVEPQPFNPIHLKEEQS